MRKLINEPGEVVEDLVQGLIRSNGNLTRVSGWPVVVRTERPETTAVISGGGSGHEPAHAGFVGRGMLDAAVCGPVFTSPSVDAVSAALEAVGEAREVLVIVKNYTGDRLNFGLAAREARAQGRVVEHVVVADDVALGDSAGAGRRGIAGTVLVHKIAGALAERGLGAVQIKQHLESFLSGMGSMGIALDPALSPGATEPNFELGSHEVEWGLGIHGEPGRERGRADSARHVAERLVESIVGDRGLEAGRSVVVLVNGLGSTPPMELEILTGEVVAAVEAAGLRPELVFSGSLLTSLDMAGASVTLAAADPHVLELLKEPTAAPAWVPGRIPGSPEAVTVRLPQPLAELDGGRAVPGQLLSALDRAAQAVIEAEAHLTDLDRRVGDGDLGTNLCRGAAAVQRERDRLSVAPDVATWFRALARLLRQEVGGTSGPLYSLLALTTGESHDDGASSPDPQALRRGFSAAVAAIEELGGAKLGDSTMLDALIPAARAAEDGANAAEVVAAALEGTRATVAVQAQRGRSSYVGDRSVGVADPGAVAVCVWLAAALDVELDPETAASLLAHSDQG